MTTEHPELPDELAGLEPLPTRVLMQRVHDRMPVIGKEHRAPQQMGGYAFRGIEDILAALNPLLAEHGLYYTPEVIDLQRRDITIPGRNTVMVETLLHANLTFHGPVPGDRVEMDAWGEARDAGDKGVPKAMTNAIKNALLAWLALPTEDTARDDTDRYVTEEAADPEHMSKVRTFVAAVRSARENATVESTFLDHIRQAYGKNPQEIAQLSPDQLDAAMDELMTEIERGQEPFEGAGVQLEETGKYGYENWTKHEINDEIEKVLGERLPDSVKHDELVERLRAFDAIPGNRPEGYDEPDEKPY